MISCLRGLLVGMNNFSENKCCCMQIPDMMDQFINLLISHWMVQEFCQLGTNFPDSKIKLTFRITYDK